MSLAAVATRSPSDSLSLGGGEAPSLGCTRPPGIRTPAMRTMESLPSYGRQVVQGYRPPSRARGFPDCYHTIGLRLQRSSYSALAPRRQTANGAPAQGAPFAECT